MLGSNCVVRERDCLELMIARRALAEHLQMMYPRDISLEGDECFEAMMSPKGRDCSEAIEEPRGIGLSLHV